MRKVYKVYKSKCGTQYYAANIHYPNIPIFGSMSAKKSVATQASADRMCLTRKEYNSLKG